MLDNCQQLRDVFVQTSNFNLEEIYPLMYMYIYIYIYSKTHVL